MTNADRLAHLGVPTEVAKEIVKQISEANPPADPVTNEQIEQAIADKTEIAALTPASTAADIVAALQA